jgi:predicted metal-dependent phosphoesterase TrpH
MRTMMRADLHVHSRHSGATDLPVLRHFGRECYSEPGAVYERARQRGMDLVTLTDHDSVEGALAIAHLPFTFVSEEVTLVLEGGRHAHLGVFDITEGQHARISTLRFDPEALFAYFAEERLPACFNHPFSALTGPRQLVDFQAVLGRVSLVESLNGSMPLAHNDAARRLGRGAGMAGVGGSDSHTLAGVARAFTCVPGAATREEFLDGLRRGLTVPRGRSGTYARLTAEVSRIFAAAYHHALLDPETLRDPLRLVALVGLFPLLPLIPAFTAGIYAHERVFGERWFGRFRDSAGRPRSWPVLPPTGFGAGSLPGTAEVHS